MALEIPKADHFERQVRNLQIQRASADGLSRSLLADRYGLSLRQIGNIRRLDNGHRPAT
jgi:Mor family transcriptional regulator